MSNIKFFCPFCKQSLEAPPDMDGFLIDCPACSKKIKVSTSQLSPRVVALPPPLLQHHGSTATGFKFAPGFRRIYALYSVILILFFLSPWPSNVSPSSRAWDRWNKTEFDRWYSDDIRSLGNEAHKRDVAYLADLTRRYPDGVISEKNAPSEAPGAEVYSEDLAAEVLKQGGTIGFDHENKKWVYTDQALLWHALSVRQECASKGGRLVRGFVLFWIVNISWILIIMLIAPFIVFRAGRWVYDGFHQ